MIANARKDLVDEIFKLTGKKIEQSDPVVVAALFQSACVKRAGDEVAASLSAIAERTKAEAAFAHARNQELISKIPIMIKAAHDPLQRRAAGHDDEGNLSRATGVQQWKSRWGQTAMAIACFAIGAACAGALGLLTGQFSATLAQDAAVGRAFTRALPYLRPDDKARLLAEIERQR